MENTRNFSLFVLCITVFMLYFAWNTDTINLKNKINAKADEQNVIISNDISNKTISVKTDVYDLTIDLVGGDIVSTKLLNYPISTEDRNPIELLKSVNDYTYTMALGLIGQDGPDRQQRPLYHSEKKKYSMNGKQDTLDVSLKFQENNIEYTKTFKFYKGQYRIDVEYEIANNSEKEIKLKTFGEIRQSINKPVSDDQQLFIAGSWTGGIYSTENTTYNKLELENLAEPNSQGQRYNDLDSTKGGWIGMIQHYFTVAYIGDSNSTNNIYSRGSGINKEDSSKAEIAHIGMKGTEYSIQPNSQLKISNKLWIGPKIQKEMDETAPHLGRTLDYGWLWFISEFLMMVMNFIHGFVGNWGFSIIIITLIVRGLMYPLTKAQYTSMAKMKLIAPKLKEIKERYQNDPENFRKATMEIYQKEHVNPASGCLPILIQMPIFIALYWALMESVDLRQAPFILWIKDLSVNDPYFILPLLYGASMFMIQKLSQSNTQMVNPMHQKIFLMMPVIFTLMFMMFPAGLTLYWCVSNIITIIQLKMIYSHLEKIGLHKKK